MANSTSAIRATSASAAKEDFDRDGYVVMRAFYTPPEVAEIQFGLNRYLKEVGPNLPPGALMYEDKSRPETLKQMAHIAKHDARLRELLDHGKVKVLAEQLLAGPVTGFELEWFNKMPHDSRATPAHQDGYYFMLEPQEALTAWLALDDVDEENGCLRYVRGSHLKGLRAHGSSGVLGFSQGVLDFGTDDLREEVAVCAQPGDLLVHHCMTIHRAEANRSSHRHRRSLGLIYFSSRAKQNVAATQAYQRRLLEDLKNRQRL